MQKYFVFSSQVVLLFKEWQITGTLVFVGSLFGVFTFTLLFHLASSYHSRLEKRGKKKEKFVIVQSGNYGTFEVSSESCDEFDTPPATRFFRSVCKRTLFTWRYILSSLSYVVLIAANYLVMLSVMTFNAWLLITVCLATGLAYYFIPSSPKETRKLTCGSSEGVRSSLFYKTKYQEVKN